MKVPFKALTEKLKVIKNGLTYKKLSLYNILYVCLQKSISLKVLLKFLCKPDPFKARIEKLNIIKNGFAYNKVWVILTFYMANSNSFVA